MKQKLKQLPPGLKTRFAPSPTGYLHLGHLASAIYVWGIADMIHATVSLRIEDHDRQRCRPEYTQALREDLLWFGFIDEKTSVTLQSEQSAHYTNAAHCLAEAGWIYACTCSRKDLAQRMGLELAEGELRYDGTCRKKNLELPSSALRLRLNPDHVQFEDMMMGFQDQAPLVQCGDFLIRDKHHNWTYNFCVTVDDKHDEIDLIIRGIDILDATGRQLLLARLLGSQEPKYFLHHPLLREPSGAKLSKRDGSTALRMLREQGYTKEDLLGMAAYHMGLTDKPRGLKREDIGGLFA